MAERPLETKLMESLDAGHLRAGAPVFAKVMYDWNSPGCHLRAGSTVSGRVVAAQGHRQGAQPPSLTILFERADCNGDKAASFGLVLFSVIGAVAQTEASGMVDSGGLFGSVSAPLHLQGGGSATGSAAPPPAYDPTKDMSLRSAASEKPKEAAPGQVSNLRNVSMTVGTGLEGGSVLTTTGRGLRVERESEMVLLPRPTPTPTGLARKELPPAENLTRATSPFPEPNSSTARVDAVPPPAPDETEVCTGTCMVVGGEGSTLGKAGAGARLALDGFGFVPHENREFTAFPYESALVYLDASHLLFTFDPHDLRRRAGDSLRPDAMHTIRAVLVNPSTRQVDRIVNWTVLGEGQHVWPAGNGRILARVGHDLRLYGNGLNLIAARTFPGTMAWVSVSPAGKMVAVGILEERHTAALHEELAHVTGREPEEGIRVHLLDSDLKTIFETEQRSVEGQPVLSATGEVRASLGHGRRWTIRETRVDRSEHKVAEVISGCELEMDTTISGYVFVVGCSMSPLTNWYRMLRMDGHTVLKGKGSSQDVEQAVSASSADGRFAVRVVKARRSMANGASFHKDDLSGEQINVFDVQEGRRLAAIALAAVPLSVQSFALSPTGKQVAVLGSGEILFYDLPK